MAYTKSKARTGRSTIISIGGVTGAGGSETFTPIFEITKSPFGGSSWNKIDRSNFNSGTDEEKGKGMRDPGQVTLEGNDVDDDPGQILLLAAYNDGDNPYDFKVQTKATTGYSAGTIYLFSALVMSFDRTVELKADRTFSSKLEISGPVAVTPAVPSA
jgi:hypothetical protein